MGCGSSKAAPPQTAVQVSPHQSPVSVSKIDIEKRLNQFEATAKIGGTAVASPKDSGFVPATNIQFEVPPAFKDKQPLVPVGFSKIKSLDSIEIPSPAGKEGEETVVDILETTTADDE